MENRNAILDGLRLVAALAVLIFHFGFRGYVAEGFQLLRYPEIADFAKYGFLGVELFFIISGYVILMSVQGRSPRSFTIARMVRLYPTFWLCAFATFVVVNLLGQTHLATSPLQAAANIPILASVFGAPYIDGVYWSLAIEIQFYVVVAALYFSVPPKHLATALAIWVAAGAIFFVASQTLGINFRYPCSSYAGFFGIGSAIYLAENGRRSRSVWLLYLVSLVSAFIRLFAYLESASTTLHVEVSLPIMTAILIASVAAVHLSHRIRITSSRLLTTLTFAGGMTYPLYLLHQNIGYSILNRFFDEGSRWSGFVVVVVLMLVLSAFVYVIYDRPVRTALMRQLGSRRKAATVERAPG